MLRYLSRFLLGVSCLGTVIASQPVATSPTAHTDLICPTENPTDCYPRIFQATENFQIVREGQDLPLGLHVRMNIWTGEKEARLNIPMDGDDQLDGLSTEQSVVVVEQPEDGRTEDLQALRDQVPPKVPEYVNTGKILPPREPDGGSCDSENFWNALLALSRNHLSNDAIDAALLDLSDLAHDIYYGVELAKRGDVLRNLMIFMSSESIHRRRQAASILGGSVQNNPTALKEARQAWESLMHLECEKDAKDKRDCESRSLIKQLQQSLQQETDPAVTKAKISLLAGLTKDPGMRDDFLADAGMELLLSIFVRQDKQWDSTRVKIAQYVIDTFLDEDMGAQLGIWPKYSLLDTKHCAKPEHTLNEGCWEYHLEKVKLEAGAEAGEWQTELLRLLRKTRVATRGENHYTSDREL